MRRLFAWLRYALGRHGLSVQGIATSSFCITEACRSTSFVVHFFEDETHAYVSCPDCDARFLMNVG